MLNYMEPVQPTNGFQMGSPESEPGHFPYADIDPEVLAEYGLTPDWTNETQHSVKLTKGFYMGVSQLFIAHYYQMTGFNPSYFNYSSPSMFPADGVTWFDAVEYCNRLSEYEGFTPVYTITDKVMHPQWPSIVSATVVWNDKAANGYRLPTEAEWEYACRAGTTTAYNTGNTISSFTVSGDNIADLGQANFVNEDGYTLTSPLIAFNYDPNDWELYCMHGNVEEWCWDLFDEEDYGTAAQTDPTGPASSPFDEDYRVTRGGSYLDTAGYLRSAARWGYPTDLDAKYISFRIVRNMPTTPGPGVKMVNNGQDRATRMQRMQMEMRQLVLPQNIPHRVQGTQQVIPQGLPQAIRKDDNSAPFRMTPQALRRKAFFE
jgi:formylglycine-generating enzyme required for sulfatase activity